MIASRKRKSSSHVQDQVHCRGNSSKLNHQPPSNKLLQQLDHLLKRCFGGIIFSLWNISSIIFSKQNKVFYYTENYIIGFSLYGGFVQLILWSRSDIISTLDLSRGSSTGLAASPNLFVYFVFGVVMYKTCRYQNVCHSSNNFFACVF